MIKALVTFSFWYVFFWYVLLTWNAKIDIKRWNEADERKQTNIYIYILGFILSGNEESLLFILNVYLHVFYIVQTFSYMGLYFIFFWNIFRLDICLISKLLYKGPFLYLSV